MEKNKRNGMKHIVALLLFCLVVSIGTVSLADEKGTVIAKSAVIRAAADPNSTKLASVPSGKVIDVIGKATGTDNNKWYQVYVDGNTKGYIRGDLLKVDNDANLPTVDGGNASQPADTASATVTPTAGTQVTVISNNTNIREDASTTSASKAKANRGSVLTVTGETTGTDGKKWYQVSFSYQNEEKTGFIRADLVTVDNVPADTATTQITGEVPGEEQPAEQPAETEQPAEQPAETTQPDSNAITVLNVDAEPPYVMEEFKSRIFTLPGDEQQYNGYVNGKFLICYARKADGEEGWYLVDTEQNVFQRYAYTVDGVAVPKNGLGSVGLVPVIVLVVIIIVLVAAVGFLALKLRGQGSSYKRYRGYGDDDDQDDDIEDLEELEDDDEEPQPVRRPQGQPPRRMQGQGGNPSGSSASQGQPARRPQGQQPPRHPQSQQPPRRPQGQGTAQGQPGNAPGQGGNPPGGSTSQAQPRRSPVQPGGSSSSNNGARPQNQQIPRRPQGGNGGQPSKRPQPQNDRVPGEKGQAQKGYKAKNLLEEDDMDFMDIE